MKRFALGLSLCAFPFAASSRAGDCDGRPGWELRIPGQAKVGSKITVCLEGPPNSAAFFMASLGDGPTRTNYGILCLDFPLILSFPLMLHADGKVCFECGLPCDDALIGLIVYTQFLTCSPNRGVSNGASTLFTAGDCEDDYCSYTQGGWGQKCAGHNVGCLRDAHFDQLFPYGLILGDQDGDDDDSEFSLILTSAKAVLDFLPAGGPSGSLDQDQIDPKSSSAGVLAGQLAAAKLNVAFHAAGLFNGDGVDGIGLDDLHFASCVDDDLIGLSVRDVIDLSDLVLSGHVGDGVDLDGDGHDDASASDLSDALTALNENYHECSTNHGCLELPKH